MKKLLGIIVLGLLLSSNVYAGLLDIFKGSNKIIFKDCHTISRYTQEREIVFDEHTFELDKEKKTIVRTFIWNDELKKSLEKTDKKKIPKINQENIRIVSVGDKYISAKNNEGDEYVFNLSKKTIQANIKLGSTDAQVKIICK